MSFAGLIVGGIELYAVVGCLVAVVFLLYGIDRVDPSARGSYVFRILLIPGVIGLWPLVLWRWRVLERSQSGPFERADPS